MPPIPAHGPALRLALLASGVPGLDAAPAPLAAPLDPDALAAFHPLWAADVGALGPWRLEGDAWTPAAPAEGQVLVCGPCASTMDVARELVRTGELSPWGSVLTPVQSAGRGQLRRHWLAGAGNLMATLRCPEESGPWNDLRPLVLGYLLAEALSALGGAVEVKWPNDLLMSGRKVAGILVEERAGCVLAGFGLNLAWAPPEAALRDGHCLPADCFHPQDCGLGPLRLWLALVKLLETGYGTLLETFTPSEFLTLFRARLAWAGRRVLVHEGADLRYEAVVRGVSEEGGLVLDRAGREIVLLAGDVIPV